MGEKILEKCNCCDEMHEQDNPPVKYHGTTVKVCPNIPKDFIFSPDLFMKQWQEVTKGEIYTFPTIEDAINGTNEGVKNVNPKTVDSIFTVTENDAENKSVTIEVSNKNNLKQSTKLRV